MKKNLIYFFTGIFFASGISFFVNTLQENLENYFYAQIAKSFEERVILNLGTRSFQKNFPEIEANSVYALKISKTGREKILYRKNEKKILPIASLSKLMTALVVLKDPQNYDFSEKVRISKQAASQEDVPEYGNLKEGEEKKVEDLLFLMLAFSSNDAAYALSEKIGVENFVEKMNKLAKELNLQNTHFSNPTGLDPENKEWKKENESFFNYSTAKDLIKLGKYILKEFPIIFEFSNQKEKIEILPNQKIIGMKTGYTKEAGGCLFVIFVDDKDNFYLNLIIGAKDKEERFKEMQKLIDWINGKI